MSQLSYPFLDAVFQPELKLVKLTWKSLAVGKPRRDALLAVAGRTQELGITRWLVDARAVYVVAQEDEDWSRETLMPMLFKGGLKALASMSTHSAMAAFANAISKGSGLETKVFANEPEALAWLNTVA